VTRPTRDDLANATGHLEELAWRYHSRNNPNGWPDVALLVDLLVWLDGELEHAKQAAAYGGGSDAHTIGRHGLGRPVEERLDFGTDDEDRRNTRPRLRPELADPLVRDLKKLRAGWHTELAQLVDRWTERSREAANWPMRTEQTG
jgi:hypothetical protein